MKSVVTPSEPGWDLLCNAVRWGGETFANTELGNNFVTEFKNGQGYEDEDRIWWKVSTLFL